MCILEESEAHKEDSYGLERALVRHYNCDRSRPICLFDFTLKSLVLDFQAFRIPDLKGYNQDERIIQDYFYSDFTLPEPTKRPDVPIYHGYHICDQSNFAEKFKMLFNNKQQDIQDLGRLFQNPVMPVSNITSQSVSYLRLLQFQRYLTDVVSCYCDPNTDHVCIKRLVHLRN